MNFKSVLRLTRASFVVFFTSCLLCLQPIFAITCIETLDPVDVELTVDQKLDYAISLSSMVKGLESDIYSFRGLFKRKSDQPILAELDKMLVGLQETGLDIDQFADLLLEGNNVESALFEKTLQGLTELSAEIEKIKYGNFEFQDKIIDTSRLSYLQKNLSEVVPDKIYKATTYNQGQEISFLFSENLVSELFNSNNNLLKVAIEKSLSSIRQGVYPGTYRGQGIIKVIQMEKGFVEIRQRSTSGNVRIYGYTHENTIHFVYWSDSSNHGSNQLKKVNSAIKRAKELRGH